MPYIKQEMRSNLNKISDSLLSELKELSEKNNCTVDGLLNYFVTRTIKKAYKKSYTSFNAAIGMLECTKLEFYTMDVREYENLKIMENGAVED